VAEGAAAHHAGSAPAPCGARRAADLMPTGFAVVVAAEHVLDQGNVEGGFPAYSG
jgi:hypothetical protein